MSSQALSVSIFLITSLFTFNFFAVHFYTVGLSGLSLRSRKPFDTSVFSKKVTDLVFNHDHKKSLIMTIKRLMMFVTGKADRFGF